MKLQILSIVFLKLEKMYHLFKIKSYFSLNYYNFSICLNYTQPVKCYLNYIYSFKEITTRNKLILAADFCLVLCLSGYIVLWIYNV